MGATCGCASPIAQATLRACFPIYLEAVQVHLPYGLSFMQYDTILGKGAFKTVYKGFDEREGIEVAWNQVKSHDFIKEGHKLTQEINVLKNMKHKNVMCFYDSWIDEESGTVNFITELFTSGTLRQYVCTLCCTLCCVCHVDPGRMQTKPVPQVPAETQEPWKERAKTMGMANPSGTGVSSRAQSSHHSSRP